MRRDGAREALPEGALWNIVDWIPEMLNARLRKRGGYTHASQNLASVQPSASYVNAGIVAEYLAGQSILAFDEDGRAYEIESTSVTEDIGAAIITRNPLFYNDMVIVPSATAAAAPKKITRAVGTHTIANLAGSPPSGQYGLVYKDVIWLSNGRTTYFSEAGNAEVWDTTNKFMNVSYPITGYAGMSNAVLIFSKQRAARVRGSIPPPDTDFIVDDPVFEVGCTDNRSIAYYRDKVIFANAQGLYLTDGSVPEDITRLAGMKSWWRDVMKGREGFSTGAEYSDVTWTIAGGIDGDYYLYTIMNGSTLVDSGMIDLTRFSWTRFANFDASFYFPRLYPQELFFGRRAQPFVARTSPIWVPTAATKADGDGDPVLPVLETGYFEGEVGVKTLLRLFVGYDIRDAATDNPFLSVAYIDSPEETSYTVLTPNLTETSAYIRQMLQMDVSALGLALKIEQSNPSADTRLYGIELDAQQREPSR